MSSLLTGADAIIRRLRPRSITDILDQAFRLYRSHFLTFLAITAIVYVPVQIGVQASNVLLQGSASGLRSSAGGDTSSEALSRTMNEQLITIFVLFGVLIAFAVLGGLLQYLSQGALTSAIAESYLDREVSFGAAYRSMAKRIGALIGAIALQILIVIAIFLPLVLVTLAALGLSANSGSGSNGILAFFCLAFLLAVPLTVFLAYVLVRLTLVVPAIMVERLGPRAGMRRSWNLVKGYWWRTLVLHIVLGLLGAVVSAGPAYLVVAIVTLAARNIDPVTNSIIVGAITVIVSMFYVPLQLTSNTLYYFDLRVRKEGYDLETALDRRFSPAAQSGHGILPEGGVGEYAAGQQGAISPPVLGYTPPPQRYGYTPPPRGAAPSESPDEPQPGPRENA